MHVTPELEVPGSNPAGATSRERTVLGARVSVTPRAGRGAARDTEGKFTMELGPYLPLPYPTALATHCGTGEQARQERGAHSLRPQPIPASAAAHPSGSQCVQTKGRHILTTRRNQSNASTAHTRPEPTRTSAAKPHVRPGEPCQRQWKGCNGLSLTPGRTHAQSAAHGRTSPWPLPVGCMAGTRPTAARLGS